MKYLKRVLPIFLILFSIFIVFKPWFHFLEISGGDAPLYFEENIKNLSLMPYIWSTRGLGQMNLLLYSFPYLILPLKILSLVNMPWVIIERLLWYWPFIIITILSSYYLVKTVFPQMKYKYLTPYLYLFNSYILMIIGGGQISIALAYAISPLALAIYYRLINERNNKLLIPAGIISSIIISFEPRIALLMILPILLYAVSQYKFSLMRYIHIFLTPVIIIIGLHFYWIFPSVVTKLSAANLIYEPSFSSTGWVKFLSFASFSNSISLLHPNWPENIFGKIYFMRPEFLGIPILAFSALYYHARKKAVWGFSLLAIIGAFLAKGVNPPFGFIYQKLYDTLPGFNLFRDPTKFYIYVAIAYCLLIPFALENIAISLKRKIKKPSIPVNFILLLIFIVFNVFLLREAFAGSLEGTFKAKTIPPNYIRLKDFLQSQSSFLRTFWIPKLQRYGFYEDNYSAVFANEYFHSNDPDVIVSMLKKVGMEEELRLYGIKYIIVPYDSEKEFFLTDRKYDQTKRKKIEKEMDTITWLTKSPEFKKISLYELKNSKDHFWIDNNKGEIKYTMINPTKYLLKGTTNGHVKLVFSETYDPSWWLTIDNKMYQSDVDYQNLNSFSINKKGTWQGTVENTLQKYLTYGVYVSIISAVILLVVSLYFYILKR